MRNASFLSSALVSLSILSATFLSCSQYEYASPTPGILEIRLRVKNTRTDLIPFSVANYFALTLTELEATKPDGSFLRILTDLNAIRRKSDGDTLNCLSFSARDSVILMGRVYAPPTTFTGLEIEIKPDPFLIVSTGIVPSFIEVRQPAPAPPTLRTLPTTGSVLNVEVKEGKTTLVVVTLDLDLTLIRRSEWFEYNPTFYVSSIQTF